MRHWFLRCASNLKCHVRADDSVLLHQMKIGPKGIALIQEFEGCKLAAYRDIVGVVTIGYGHTGSAKMGVTITQDEADELLYGDILNFEECVTKAIRVQVVQEEFDACVSLAFNIGCNAFRASTLLRRLNACQFTEAADAFLMWNMAGGKVVPGLARRRAAERDLFLS